MRQFLKRKIVWIPLVILLVVAFVFSFFRGGETHQSITFAEVVADAQSGKVHSIEITGPSLIVRLRDNTTYSSRAGKDTDVTQVLQNAGVTVGGSTPGAIDVSYQDESHPLWGWIFWLGVLALIGLIVYFAVLFAIRRARKDPQQ